MIATDSRAQPTGYGLGRHGWVSVEVGDRRQIQPLAASRRMGAHVVSAHDGSEDKIVIAEDEAADRHYVRSG